MRARFLCPNENFNCVLCCVVTLHSSFCRFFYFCIYIFINCYVLYIFLIGSVTSEHQCCSLDAFPFHRYCFGCCCYWRCSISFDMLSTEKHENNRDLERSAASYRNHSEHTWTNISFFPFFVFLATSEYTISTLARTVCVWVCDPLG